MSDRASIDLLERIVSISSPSGEERELAGFLHGHLLEEGFQAWVDEVGNVIGATGATAGPTVVLLSHLDTVPGELPVRIEGSRLHGRGSVDAKGSLAAMIRAAARCSDLPLRLLVVGAVEEETPRSRGADHLARALDPDAVVVGEPTGWSKVAIGYKGKLDLAFQVRRPRVHSSAPVAKASEIAVDLWSRLRDLLGDGLGAGQGDGGGHGDGRGHGHGRGRGGGDFWRATAALEELHGDLADARMRVSCRLPPGFDATAFLDALERHADGGCIEVLNLIGAVVTERRDPVAGALRAGIRALGGRPAHVLKSGTSDMNTVRPRWNVPMASYGPGDSSLDHSDNECIELDDYLRGIEVLVVALRELARDGRHWA